MRIAILVLTMVCTANAVTAQTRAVRVAEQDEVRTKVETALLASVRGDTAELAAIFANDYRMGDREGGTVNRFVRLRQVALKQGPRGVAPRPAYVRVMGDVAVAGGRMPNSRDEWLQIWDRQAGEWKLSYEEHARPKRGRRR